MNLPYAMKKMNLNPQKMKKNENSVIQAS